MIAAEFAKLVKNAKRRADGKWWDARCPAHDDKRASLSFTDGDHALVVECHAGCSRERIATAAGLRAGDFSHRANGDAKERPRIIATYTYTDERGAPLYEVVRLDPKDFRCRRADGVWSMGGVRRVPYRLHELAEAPRVFVVEGEKDADALVSLGLIATCNEGGAGKWREEHTRALIAAAVPEVVVLRDNDAAGATHQSWIATSCDAAGLRVKRLDLPGLPPKGDVSDFIGTQRAAGRTDDEIRDALIGLADEAPVFTLDEAGAPSAPATTEPELRREGFDLTLA
jgi:5S rRNA maturation endonuclease (ribonuclease M5)